MWKSLPARDSVASINSIYDTWLQGRSTEQSGSSSWAHSSILTLLQLPSSTQSTHLITMPRQQSHLLQSDLSWHLWICTLTHLTQHMRCLWQLIRFSTLRYASDAEETGMVDSKAGLQHSSNFTFFYIASLQAGGRFVMQS